MEVNAEGDYTNKDGGPRLSVDPGQRVMVSSAKGAECSLKDITDALQARLAG